jgi:WD40 repeat protein
LPGIARWQIRFPQPAQPVTDGGPQSIRCARWTPDGQLLAVASGSGHLHLLAPDGRRLQTVLAHAGLMYRIAWASDGRRLASTGLDGTVRIWTPQLDPVCTRRQHQTVTLSAAWDRVTGRLATADNRGHVRIWDAAGAPLGDLMSQDHWGFALAWSPDGKWLRSDVGLWDGELKPQPLQTQGDELVDLAWSPDGRWLAGACRRENTVRLWDSQGSPGPTLGGHTKRVWGVAWSHDGQTLASASDDGAVRIWQTDGKLLHDLRAHADRAWTLSFAPDGTLVSGSYDKTVIAWDSKSGEPKWVLALLKDGYTATFTAAGQLIDGNLDAVEDELVYVVETGDRQVQTLSPSEFFGRVPAGRLARH